MVKRLGKPFLRIPTNFVPGVMLVKRLLIDGKMTRKIHQRSKTFQIVQIALTQTRTGLKDNLSRIEIV
jgi:hypothetical protein